MSYPPDRYTGDTGEVSGLYRPADSKPELSRPTGTASYLATGASTNGHFGLYRWDMAGPRTGPGAHFHRTMSESFYILAGTVRLYNGETWVDATPGDYLYVPEGGIHAFANESGEFASMLILFAPGAPREAYFEEIADIANTGRTLTDEEWTELYRRHDQYMV